MGYHAGRINDPTRPERVRLDQNLDRLITAFEYQLEKALFVCTVLKPTQVNRYKSIKVYGLTILKELCKMTP